LTHSAHWLADPRLRAALGPWLERERVRVEAIGESGGSLTET
jgi:predicted N-acyltransferase